MLDKLLPDTVYWRASCATARGQLQAVLDEYLHHLATAEGMVTSDDERLHDLARTARAALALRPSRYETFDPMHPDDRIGFTSRFALRFGSRRQTEDSARQPEIRNALNSPFWPFIVDDVHRPGRTPLTRRCRPGRARREVSCALGARGNGFVRASVDHAERLSCLIGTRRDTPERALPRVWPTMSGVNRSDAGLPEFWSASRRRRTTNLPTRFIEQAAGYASGPGPSLDSLDGGRPCTG
jgi:hypothetical protein